MKISSSKLSLLACLLSGTLSLNAGYSNIAFFGDSLSDVGAFGNMPVGTLNGTPVTLPSNANWTSNNGWNWTNFLGAQYGHAVIANNQDNQWITTGGNNFAQGGAMAQHYDEMVAQLPIAAHVGQYAPDKVTLIHSVQQQVDRYLQQNGGKVNPNGLYSIWIGGNDVKAAVGTLNVNSAMTVLNTSATVAAQSALKLKNAGAKVIIMPNLPNLAATPVGLYAALEALKGGLDALAAWKPQQSTLQTNLVVAAIKPLKEKIKVYINQAWSAANKVLNSSDGKYDAAVVTAAYEAAQKELSTIPMFGSAAGNLLEMLFTGKPLTQVNINVAFWTISIPIDSLNLPTDFPGALAALGSLSEHYNQALDQSIIANGLQGNVVRPNVAKLFEELLGNPELFGFTNVMGAPCLDALTCSDSKDKTNTNFVFNDPLHPTSGAHQVIAAYTSGLLEAPNFIATLAESTLNNARQLGMVLDSRYQTLRAQQREAGRFSVFADGAWNRDRNEYDDLLMKPKGKFYTLGMDYQLTDTIALGLSGSKQYGNTDFSSQNTTGRVQDRSTLVAVYGSYTGEQFWLDTDVHWGTGNLAIERSVNLGPTQINNWSDTRQRQYGMRLATGYRFAVGPVHTGPIVGIEHLRLTVDDLTDKIENSSSMTFDQQRINSTRARFGWQIDGAFGPVKPYAKWQWVHELKASDREVTAGLTSTTGKWTTNLGKPESQWMEWNVGTQIEVTRNFLLYGQLQATTQHRAGNSYGGNLGFAVTF